MIGKKTFKEYHFINLYKVFYLVHLKQETHNRFINHSIMLNNAICAKRPRGLVKLKLLVNIINKIIPYLIINNQPSVP